MESSKNNGEKIMISQRKTPRNVVTNKTKRHKSNLNDKKNKKPNTSGIMSSNYTNQLISLIKKIHSPHE